MTARLKQAMRDHFARFRFAKYGGRQTPWVFHYERSRRRANAADRIASFRNSFKHRGGEGEAAQRLSPARSAAPEGYEVARGGCNPVLVKEAVGHSDLRTTIVSRGTVDRKGDHVTCYESTGTVADNELLATRLQEERTYWPNPNRADYFLVSTITPPV